MQSFQVNIFFANIIYSVILNSLLRFCFLNNVFKLISFFLEFLFSFMQLLFQLHDVDLCLFCCSIAYIMPLSPIIYHLFTKLVDIIIITCRWLYRAASLIQVCADVVRWLFCWLGIVSHFGSDLLLKISHWATFWAIDSINVTVIMSLDKLWLSIDCILCFRTLKVCGSRVSLILNQSISQRSWLLPTVLPTPGT